jgi:uncharacterized protein YjbJ (UPF0337 family)
MSDIKKEGREEQSTGRLEKAVGEAAGNEELETEGRVREAQGEMKEGLGDADKDVSDAADAARDALKD